MNDLRVADFTSKSGDSCLLSCSPASSSVDESRVSLSVLELKAVGADESSLLSEESFEVVTKLLYDLESPVSCIGDVIQTLLNSLSERPCDSFLIPVGLQNGNIEIIQVSVDMNRDVNTGALGNDELLDDWSLDDLFSVHSEKTVEVVSRYKLYEFESGGAVTSLHSLAFGKEGEMLLFATVGENGATAVEGGSNSFVLSIGSLDTGILAVSGMHTLALFQGDMKAAHVRRTLHRINAVTKFSQNQSNHKDDAQDSEKEVRKGKKSSRNIRSDYAFIGFDSGELYYFPSAQTKLLDTNKSIVLSAVCRFHGPILDAGIILSRESLVQDYTSSAAENARLVLSIDNASEKNANAGRLAVSQVVLRLFATTEEELVIRPTTSSFQGYADINGMGSDNVDGNRVVRSSIWESFNLERLLAGSECDSQLAFIFKYVLDCENTLCLVGRRPDYSIFCLKCLDNFDKSRQNDPYSNNHAAKTASSVLGEGGLSNIARLTQEAAIVEEEKLKELSFVDEEISRIASLVQWTQGHSQNSTSKAIGLNDDVVLYKLIGRVSSVAANDILHRATTAGACDESVSLNVNELKKIRGKKNVKNLKISAQWGGWGEMFRYNCASNSHWKSVLQWSLRLQSHPNSLQGGSLLVSLLLPYSHPQTSTAAKALHGQTFTFCVQDTGAPSSLNCGTEWYSMAADFAFVNEIVSSGSSKTNGEDSGYSCTFVVPLSQVRRKSSYRLETWVNIGFLTPELAPALREHDFHQANSQYSQNFPGNSDSETNSQFTERYDNLDCGNEFTPGSPCGMSLNLMSIDLPLPLVAPVIEQGLAAEIYNDLICQKDDLSKPQQETEGVKLGNFLSTQQDERIYELKTPYGCNNDVSRILPLGVNACAIGESLDQKSNTVMTSNSPTKLALCCSYLNQEIMQGIDMSNVDEIVGSEQTDEEFKESDAFALPSSLRTAILNTSILSRELQNPEIDETETANQDMETDDTEGHSHSDSKRKISSNLDLEWTDAENGGREEVKIRVQKLWKLYQQVRES